MDKFKDLKISRSMRPENVSAGRLFQVQFDLGTSGRWYGERVGDGYRSHVEAEEARAHYWHILDYRGRLGLTGEGAGPAWPGEGR